MATVVSTIARRHPTEVVTSHVSQKDFEYVMQSLMKPFYQKLRENRGEWEGRLQRLPVVCVGPQVVLKYD